MLYSAEIDAVVSNKPLEEPIDWEKVRFVDVRMTLFNPNSRNPENFLDKNSFKWWTQSHFVNVNNVLCGFRTDDAFIIALNEYNLEELVKAKSRSRKVKLISWKFYKEQVEKIQSFKVKWESTVLVHFNLIF